MSFPSTLTAAFENALTNPPLPWETHIGATFGGAPTRHRLTLRFGEDVDVGPLELLIAERLERQAPWYVLAGRWVYLSPRLVVLEVKGTSSRPPGNDGGVQGALLRALLEVAGGALLELETERFTDGPFEDSPAKVRAGEAARAFLEKLV